MAAALAVTGLSGCGAASGETSSGREKVRLMVWSPQNDQSKDNGQWLQTMCEAFAEEHPEVVSAFLDRYQESVDYVNSNVEEAAQLVGQYEIVTAEVAQKALPECNIVFIEGDEMKEKLSGYLSVLFEQNPQSVGGALPDDAFYFSR